jgi:hypothetical protein
MDQKKELANDMKFCGNMYSHYSNYKLRNVLHKTRRGGENNFWDCYNKNGFYVMKCILRPKFLEVIKKEILTVLESRKLPWKPVAIAKKQVTSVLFNKVGLEKPDDYGGCEFLHHFLSGVTGEK